MYDTACGLYAVLRDRHRRAAAVAALAFFLVLPLTLL